MVDQAYIDDLLIHEIPWTTHALSKFKGLGSPAPREDRPERAREHGLIELTSLYGGRVFSLVGYVIGPTLADSWDLLDELKRRFAMNGLQHTLKWRRQGLAYLERADVVVATALDDDFPIRGRRLKWAVDLVAADPRMYADTLSTVVVGTAADVTTLGNFPTRPVLTVTGPGATCTIYNDSLTAENTIKVTGTGGATVIVDCAAKTVKVGGILHPDKVVAQETFWWSLKSGVNALRITGGGSLSVSWRDARI
ncbi:MAG: phage distal tail protein [Gaiellaceae bacterium]